MSLKGLVLLILTFSLTLSTWGEDDPARIQRQKAFREKQRRYYQKTNPNPSVTPTSPPSSSIPTSPEDTSQDTMRVYQPEANPQFEKTLSPEERQDLEMLKNLRQAAEEQIPQNQSPQENREKIRPDHHWKKYEPSTSTADPPNPTESSPPPEENEKKEMTEEEKKAKAAEEKEKARMEMRRTRRIKRKKYERRREKLNAIGN